jgi:hypothetical protein
MGAGRVNWLFGHADSSLGSDFGSSRLVSCSTVPQNLTSGRRSAADTKIPRIRGIGLGRMGPILRRHLAARTLCGPPTKIRRGNSLMEAVTTARIALVLCGLQHRRPPEPRPGLHSARPQSSACGRAQRQDPADPPAFIADAGVEPTAQGARRRMSLP